jgi:hypothetical protein
MASHAEDISSRLPTLPSAMNEKWKACDDLESAVDTGHVGEIVAKHEKLILAYYGDVLTQAQQSFASAKSIARIGFWVLAGTLVYTLLTDLLSHMTINGFTMHEPSLRPGGIGVVCGALIEFIAGVNFWLYARASKQFNAFHICLERTHRYLVAYKIAEGITDKRDETLRDLVCIMAHAPMITRQDVDMGSYQPASGSTQPKAAASEGGKA